MKCREVKYYLDEYIGGKLIDEMRKEILLHLKKCHSCRKTAGEIRMTMKSSGTIRKKIHQAEGFWETASDVNEFDPDFNLPSILYSPLKRRDDPRYRIKLRHRILRSRWLALGAPISAILIAVLISVLYFYRSTPSFWEVESLKGTPVAGSVKIDGTGNLPVGQWLKTDSHSSARIEAGLAGEVDVNPGSAVKLLDTKEPGYKIYLKLGKITANTPGSPQMLSVETPSASVLDRGSRYSVEVAEDGSSFFSVTSGSIIIKSGGENEIVPAGVVCETVRNEGPGTPYRINTDAEFKAALTRLDFGNGTKDDLETLLDNAGRQDALSLWYLLRNAEPGEVQQIYNRLAELITPPDGVTYEGIKAGNNTMLLKWWDKLGYGSKSLWDSIQG